MFIGTRSTAVPTIKITCFCVSCIITMSISYCIKKWRNACFMRITYAVITIFSVDVRSTAVTTIIITFCIVILIITITIVNLVWGFTALKNILGVNINMQKFKNSKYKIAWIIYNLFHYHLSKSNMTQVKLCCLLLNIHKLCNKLFLHLPHSSPHHQSCMQHYYSHLHKNHCQSDKIKSYHKLNNISRY